MRHCRAGPPLARPTRRWSVAQTTIGPVLAVRGDQGVQQVMLGAQVESSLAEWTLASSGRGAELGSGEDAPQVPERDDAALAPVMTALQALAAGDAGHPVPMEVSGTAFQQQTWAYLTSIPSGRTRSYAQVARAIGRPAAARAVAQACAANPVPLLVPCHRVIGSDGRLGGFSAGVEVKAALLRAEGIELV